MLRDLTGGEPALSARAQTLSRSADDAYFQGRWSDSLRDYQSLLTEPNLPPRLRMNAYERAAKSASTLGRREETKRLLDAWVANMPEASRVWGYNELIVKNLLTQKKEKAAEEHLAGLLVRSDMPWLTQSKAVVELAKLQAPRGNVDRLNQTLSMVYDRSTSNHDRVVLEDDYADFLQQLPKNQFDRFAATIPSMGKERFPGILYQFEKTRRAGDLEEARRMAQEADRLRLLADQGLLYRLVDKVAKGAPAPEQPVAEAPKELPAGKGEVALFIPLSGAFRAIGTKVAEGVELAKAHLAKSGKSFDVRVVDAGAPDALEKLKELPPEVVLIGGPMDPESVKSVAASGEMDRRVFVTFVNGLPDIAEGQKAWRFFPAPADEMRVLMKLASKDLQLANIAILRPDDRYGARQAEAFQAEAAKSGVTVAAEQTYLPTDSNSWGPAAKRILTPTQGKAPLDAVFLPDTWARAEGIVPYFPYYNAPGVVIMGTQLWSEALSNPGSRAKLDANAFRLAVCPGPWWPEGGAAGTKALREEAKAAGKHADFWVALGYDFVRMASRMDKLPAPGNAQNVTAALSKAAQGFAFAMAPISYDASGHASQSMFLFRPSAEGITPLEPQGFRDRIRAIRERAAEATATGDAKAPGQAPAPQPAKTR